MRARREGWLTLCLPLVAMAACSPIAGQDPVNTAEIIPPVETDPPPTNRATATMSPTATTASTSTPAPTYTPSATPTPALLKPDNAHSLQHLETLSLEMPARLETAFWSSDLAHVVVWTNGGWQLLAARSLNLEESGQDGMPLWQGNDDRLLVLDRHGSVRFRGWIQTEAKLDIGERRSSFYIHEIAVSPNGAWLAHVFGPSEVRLVSLQSGEEKSLSLQRNFRVEGIRSLKFNHDGSLLAIEAYAFDYPVVVAEVATGEIVYEVTGAAKPSFSPDGSKLILKGRQGLEIRNAATGVLYQRLSGGFVVPGGGPYGTAFNAWQFSFVGDALTVGVIYSSRENSQLILWDLASGQPKQTFNNMPVEVNLFLPSADGKTFLTFTPDARLRLWSMTTGEVLAQSSAYSTEGSGPALSPDGRYLAVPAIPSIKIHDLKAGEIVELGHYTEASELSVAMVGDHHLAVEVHTSGWEYFLDIWDLEARSLIGSFDKRSRCSYSADGSYMACKSQYLQVFEVERGRLLGSFGTKRLGYEWALSPGGNQIALCSQQYSDGRSQPSDNIRVYDTNDNEIVTILTAETGGICGKLAYSPDGGYLAAASGFVWSLPAGDLVSTFESHSAYLPLSIDPSSQLLLVGLNLFDLQSGRLVGSISTGDWGSEAIFLSDGRHVAVMTEAGIEIWGVTEDLGAPNSG